MALVLKNPPAKKKKKERKKRKENKQNNPSANTGDIRDTGLILGGEDPLEEGITTHSSILAWRIPWTEEPGRLRE